MLDSAVQPISLTKGISLGRTVFIDPVQSQGLVESGPRSTEVVLVTYGGLMPY